jgi:hypothetical protein
LSPCLLSLYFGELERAFDAHWTTVNFEQLPQDFTKSRKSNAS